MMGFGLLLLLAAGVAIVVALFGGRSLVTGQDRAYAWSGREHHPAAREILDERLARGEITVDEYEALRTHIRK